MQHSDECADQGGGLPQDLRDVLHARPGHTRLRVRSGRLDPGQHDERLLAPGRVLAHDLQHAVHPVRVLRQRHEVGRDLLPPRGHVGERRDVEVAEHGHRRGARDGGRRHDERVGRAPSGLLPQRLPLLDAEAVLLVDDDHAQVVEDRRVRQQRVRAHDDVDIADRQVQQYATPLLRRQGPGQQGDDDAVLLPQQRGLRREVAQGLREGAEVLGCQHLRGRQHSRLRAGVDRLEHRAQGHERLAGAHIALQQPVHGHRPGELLRDLLARVLLGGRQRERERGVERGERPVRAAGQGSRVQSLVLAPALVEHRLECERLLVPPPPGRLRRLLHRPRPVHAPVGGPQVLDPVLLPQERRDRILESGGGCGVERSPDDAPEGGRLDPLDGPVDGDRCGGGEGLLGLGALRDLAVRGEDGGVAQLQAASVVLDPGGHEQPAAGLERLDQPLLVEEDRVRRAVVVRDGDSRELSLPVLHATRADVDDRHVEDDVLAVRQLLQPADVREGARVDPAVRQVPQQAVEVTDPGRDERLPAAPGGLREDLRPRLLLRLGLRVTQRRPPATNWTVRRR